MCELRLTSSTLGCQCGFAWPDEYSLRYAQLFSHHDLGGRRTALRLEAPKLDKSGRYWTEEEHQLFLQGAELYGLKNARAIAQFVGSRTATQVRTHTQKYLIRLQKEGKAVASPSDSSELGESSMPMSDFLFPDPKVIENLRNQTNCGSEFWREEDAKKSSTPKRHPLLSPWHEKTFPSPYSSPVKQLTPAPRANLENTPFGMAVAQLSPISSRGLRLYLSSLTLAVADALPLPSLQPPLALANTLLASPEELSDLNSPEQSDLSSSGPLPHTQLHNFTIQDLWTPSPPSTPSKTDSATRPVTPFSPRSTPLSLTCQPHWQHPLELCFELSPHELFSSH